MSAQGPVKGLTAPSSAEYVDRWAVGMTRAIEMVSGVGFASGAGAMGVAREGGVMGAAVDRNSSGAALSGPVGTSGTGMAVGAGACVTRR